MFSTGRGWLRAKRRPKVMSMRVPSRMSSSGTTEETRLATACASPLPTPARCITRRKLSPRPMVAASSIVGRSGAWASATTASVAPMACPVSLPNAIGMIVWLRNSSRAAGAGAVAAAPIGLTPGHRA